jgi:hypothetical protein
MKMNEKYIRFWQFWSFHGISQTFANYVEGSQFCGLHNRELGCALIISKTSPQEVCRNENVILDFSHFKTCVLQRMLKSQFCTGFRSLDPTQKVVVAVIGKLVLVFLLRITISKLFKLKY